MSTRLTRGLLSFLLLVASLLLALFAGEGVLWWLGYPRVAPVRAAHPPQFAETREHIEFRYHFATNSAGLRYREIPLEKPSHHRRVLVLGDSYTEGFGVDVPDRFTNRLEREFRRMAQEISFINGGLTGTNPTYYARLLKYVGLGYEPDGVLVCVFANDVGNAREEPAGESIDPPAPSRSGLKGLASHWWPRIYTVLGTLKAGREYQRRSRTSDFVELVSDRARRQGIAEARIEAWVESLPQHVVDAINDGRFGTGVLTYGLVYPEFYVDSLDLDNPRSEVKWKNMVGSLDAIVSMTEREGIELAMVYLPVHFQYDPATHRADNLAVRTGTTVRSHWLTGRSEVEARLGRWAAGHDIPFLSLTEAFRSVISPERKLDYELDGHWTPAGHEVAAGAIARWLRGGGVFTFIPGASEPDAE